MRLWSWPFKGIFETIWSFCSCVAGSSRAWLGTCSGSLCLCELELPFIASLGLEVCRNTFRSCSFFLFSDLGCLKPQGLGLAESWIGRTSPRERSKPKSLSFSLCHSSHSHSCSFFCHPLPSTSTKAVAIAMKHARNVLNLTFSLSAILAYDPYQFYLYFYPTCVHILLIRQNICVWVLLPRCRYSCSSICTCWSVRRKMKSTCALGLLHSLCVLLLAGSLNALTPYFIYFISWSLSVDLASDVLSVLQVFHLSSHSCASVSIYYLVYWSAHLG